MTKHLRAVKATLIIGLVLVGTLFSTILISPETTTAEAAKFIMFDSELELTYDANAVNGAAFSPDGAPVSIPIYIKITRFSTISFKPTCWSKRSGS